ncbi:MAG TPA: CPBP family intramembrane glutamic endopeptidase, partial [Candidatus Acidoferrum sp.]|nr:CPBP family intramembrane glutamic endopeptidase [Candidatus Acidoferrum sp.]
LEFEKSSGINGILFIAPLLIFAPFFEECLYRGFLYKAFRGSYSMGTSVTLIIAWTCSTHWGYYYHSLPNALALSVFAVFLCYLREKSRSLWDCIIFHFIFNASIFLIR